MLELRKLKSGKFWASHKKIMSRPGIVKEKGLQLKMTEILKFSASIRAFRSRGLPMDSGRKFSWSSGAPLVSPGRAPLFPSTNVRSRRVVRDIRATVSPETRRCTQKNACYDCRKNGGKKTRNCGHVRLDPTRFRRPATPTNSCK